MNFVLMQKEKTIILIVNFDFGLLPLKPMDKMCNVCMAGTLQRAGSNSKVLLWVPRFLHQ